MKEKNIAALLAFTAGFVGTHHFYLGNVARGILYVFGTCGAWFFNFKIMVLIAVFEGIRFLTMSPEEFDAKYNNGQTKKERKEEKRARKEQRRSGWEDMERTLNVTTDVQGFKKEGIAQYKSYNFEAAINSFEKVLSNEPYDAATLFNISCCYSMIEDKTLSFSYLAKAVACGMKDFQKISTHDGLAYLRIQSEWDNFVANDYKPVPMETTSVPQSAPEPTPEPATEINSLDALRQLYEQRQKGIIDEAQFDKESKLLH